ncbi:MAG: DUF1573 domain-containing protein [Phycisphaerae bacterium]|nr:DUF1573 domain-containing protein [Saprospiraceae bacterium]
MLWLFLNLLVSANFGIPTSTPPPTSGILLDGERQTLTWNHLDIGHSFACHDSAWLDIGYLKPPVVEWLTERDHDFQHLRQEHPKTFVFRFKNIDTQPILLQTVRTSCGCTAATWTETSIAAGATGEIEVEYDAYKRGEFKKKIRVFFDRQRKPEILWIRGEVD